jgi:hypothetical protein
MRDVRQIMAELVRTGLSPEQIDLVMEMQEAASYQRARADMLAEQIEDRKKKGRERTEKWRTKSGDVTSRDVTKRHVRHDPSPEGSPPTPPSPKPQPEIPPSPPKGGSSPTGGRSQSRPGRPARLPEDWQASPALLAYAADHGFSEPEAAGIAEDMRNWAQANGTTKADWDATYRGFVRRDAARRDAAPGANGRAPPARRDDKRGGGFEAANPFRAEPRRSKQDTITTAFAAVRSKL